MKADAVLTRRGAFGLAALLSLVRPAPAAGRSLGHLASFTTQLVEGRTLGEGICLDAAGLEPIRVSGTCTVRRIGRNQVEGTMTIPCDGIVLELGPGPPAPWGWDTLENVR